MQLVPQEYRYIMLNNWAKDIMQDEILMQDLEYILKVKLNRNLWSTSHKDFNIHDIQIFCLNEELKNEFYIFFMLAFVQNINHKT